MATQKEQKGARFPADLCREVEKYAEEKDISESDAIRRLVRDGLRYQDLDDRLSRIEQECTPFWRGWF